MFGKRFLLNEETLHIVEEIGRHMPGGFFIYKASAGEELLYANKAVLQTFGCESLEDFKELTGFTFRGMLHPDDYPDIKKSIENQIRDDEDNMDYVEYRIVRKDGAVRWVDDYGHYTETEAYGGIYYVFISDITEKKEKAEHEIRLQQEVSDQQSKMITAMASDYRCVYYVILDTDEGICYRTDHAFENALAVDEHFHFHEKFTDYANRFVAEPYREGFLKFIDTDNIRERLSHELIIAYRYLRTEEGKEKYEMLRMAGVRRPEDRNDHIVHAVGVGFTDIDQEMRETMARNEALRVALQAAEEANKAKTAFLSSMSHEIRTPMNAIIGLNSIAMKDPETSEKTKGYLEKIDTSAQHLLSIINDILDMSRIESGNMIIRHEEFSFRKTLDQVNTIITGQCREKDLDYECRLIGKIHDYYIGDDMKLRQIMINILGNAVKFTPRGGKITFTIEETARYERKITLRLVFADTGIGMSPEYLPKIFATFSQEDSSSTSRYGSTGLGMPITRSIVELMNGTIEVESEKGVGSVFTVTVTLEQSDRKDNETEEVSLKSTEEKGKPKLKGKRILLAEDVDVNAEIMMMVLTSVEIEGERAENGRIALEKFAAHPCGYYDAILMDMRMPEMDGLEATRAIRKLNRPDAATVPIIALTANAFDEDVQRSMQAGLNAHLSKPVDPDTLYGTLEKLIR